MKLSRTMKRAIGVVVATIGFGLSLVFVWSNAWFGVMFGAFIGMFGVMALVAPDDALPEEAKEMPVRGAPPGTEPPRDS